MLMSFRIQRLCQVDVFVSGIEEGIVLCVDELRRPEKWFRNFVVVRKTVVAKVIAHRHAQSPVLQSRRVRHVRQALHCFR